MQEIETMKSVKRMVTISKEDEWYVACDIQTKVASQGKTPEEAIDNLKEALSLYFEDEDIDSIDNVIPMVTTIEVTI